jgi:hypothetical protein
MCAYLLWKAQGRRIEVPGVFDGSVEPNGDRALARRIVSYARTQRLSAAEKDQLLADIARQADIDYEALALCSERLLTLMTPQEVAEVAAAGVDIQLHTHRHYAWRNRDKWLAEIDENARCIEATTGRRPVHFCYPSGFYLPEYPQWLREHGVVSAFATPRTLPWLIPRLMDSAQFSSDHFKASVTGLATLLPNRRSSVSTWPLMD